MPGPFSLVRERNVAHFLDWYLGELARVTLPTQARIVVIGGGAVGCSIAYHLGKLGQRDVVVLEKSGLTHGSTWHAAGLVGQLRSKRNLTRLMQYSAQLYGRLEAETGQATEWKPVGSLRLASSEERWSELKRMATTARSFDFELHTLSPKEAQEKFPLITPDGVVGAVFVPNDGSVEPSSLTMAYAKGARAGGVRIVEGVLVTGFEFDGRRLTRVLTDQGAIDCEIVVNAAGIWARDVAKMAGVSVPAGAVEHQYMITEKSNAIPTGLPTLRDPDRIFYLKPEPGALAVGGWEKGTPTFGANGVPFSFGRELFQPNQDRLEAFLLPAAERLPILNELGIRTVINGPIPISPDGEPIMGLAPERDNFYVACGFTSGIAASGGAGKAMAEWIVEGEPGLDLWAFDVRRFGSHHMSAKYLAERSVDSYWRYYQIHYPIEELSSARGGRRSPLYPLLAAKNAVFGSRFGWERPNWFAPAGSEAIDKPSFEGRPNWFGPVGAECRAARERAVLIDQSSFSKYEIAGPGAFAALQRLAANDLDKPAGALVYTQLCNERGGIEADLTFARLDENRFYMVTGSAFGVRDMGWIRKHLPTDGSVTVQDLTSARATINLAGPLARRHPGEGRRRRREQRGLPLHDGARAAHRLRAGAGAARHLSRRARLGAAPADRVRRPRLRAAVGRRPRSRPGRRRLPRHRLAAAGEALPLLGLRHHARLHALRGGPGLRGVAQEEIRLHRPRRAGEGQGGRPRSAG